MKLRILFIFVLPLVCLCACERTKATPQSTEDSHTLIQRQSMDEATAHRRPYVLTAPESDLSLCPLQQSPDLPCSYIMQGDDLDTIQESCTYRDGFIAHKDTRVGQELKQAIDFEYTRDQLGRVVAVRLHEKTNQKQFASMKLSYQDDSLRLATDFEPANQKIYGYQYEDGLLTHTRYLETQLDEADAILSLSNDQAGVEIDAFSYGPDGLPRQLRRCQDSLENCANEHIEAYTYEAGKIQKKVVTSKDTPQLKIVSLYQWEGEKLISFKQLDIFSEPKPEEFLRHTRDFIYNDAGHLMRMEEWEQGIERSLVFDYECENKP